MTYEYTPFTSETLTGVGSAINDLSSFADLTQGLPTAQQVIFFSIGFVCIIASIALISRALIGDSVSPDLLAKLAVAA